ncbi:MAG: hypothetical protein RL685_4001 [Pseudomonadota bacterium]|jgi:hypothetical protein
MRRSFLWTALGLAFGVSSPALAGNTDSFYLGNEAALQGGASAATARGGTSLWYNPAGLARLEHDSIDGSMTALSLSLGQDIDLDSALPESEARRLKSSTFAVVPASLSYTRRFGFGGVGVGLFVPNQEKDVLRTRLRAPSANGGPSVELSVDGYTQLQDYYAGAAFGLSLSPFIDVGAALFATFRSELTILGVSAVLDLPMETATVMQHSTEDTQDLGLQPVLGVQLHPGAGWDAGLVLRMPVLRLYALSQTVGMNLLTREMEEAPVFQDDFDEQNGFSSTVLQPLRAHAGLARQLGAGLLALELSYQLPQKNDTIAADRRGVFNVRLGGQVRASETWTLGGGVFSDRSADRLTQDSDGRDVDYYGISVGAQRDTPYGVVSRDGLPASAGRLLIFRTTVVLSYLLGTGQIQRLELGQDANGTSQLEARNQDVIDHQIILHFGATLLD